MRNIIHNFCEVFYVTKEAPKRAQHYQLTGSKNERINDSLKKMSDVFCSHEINSEKSDIVFNVLTKKVLPESLAKEFLETEKEVRELHEKSIEERIVEAKSI